MKKEGAGMGPLVDGGSSVWVGMPTGPGRAQAGCGWEQGVFGILV